MRAKISSLVVRPLRATVAVLALVGAAHCGTGNAFVNGVSQGSQTATPRGSTAAATAASSASGATAGGAAAAPSTGSQGQKAATAGVEIDTQGGAVDLGFWSGAVTAVGTLASSPAPAARIVVGSYSTSTGVNLAYGDNGQSALPAGRKGATFTGDRGTEALLTALDALNASVVLEVQPGLAPLPTLAAEVLQHYQGHKSVAGIGINLLYYGTNNNDLGSVALSDADAQAIVQAVRGTGSSATVYLRHYSSDFMPPSARSGLGFVLDAAGFADVADMSSDYSGWASKFAPSPVQFVIGAQKDQGWACALAGGAQQLIGAAQGAGSNVNNVTWSSGTITALYPTNIFSCLN